MMFLIFMRSFRTTHSAKTAMIPAQAARVYENSRPMHSRPSKRKLKNLILKSFRPLFNTTNIAGMSNASAAPYDVWSRKNGCITRYDVSCEKYDGAWFASVYSITIEKPNT